MKLIFLIAVSVLLLTACHKTNTVTTVIMKKAFQWSAPLHGNNQAGLSGIYNGEVYLWGENNESFVMAVYTLEGSVQREFTFKKGKGPGELQFPFKGIITDNSIIIYDYWLRRFSIYSLDGKPIDDIAITDPDLLNVTGFFFINNTLYVHCSEKCLLASIDTATGTLTKKILYVKEPEKNADEIPILSGSMHYNSKEKKIYIAYSNMPFHIDVFDLSLQKIDEMQIPTAKNYEPYRYKVIKSGKSIYMTSIGDDLAASIHDWNNKLLIPLPMTISGDPNNPNTAEPDNGYSVVDPITKKITAMIYDETFRKTAGLMYFTIGLEKNMVVLLVYVQDEAAYEKAFGVKPGNGLNILVYSIDNKDSV